jgi:hypothetical protein
VETTVTDDERTFLAALETWAVEHWRPQERFHGEFDAAIFAVEARPEIHPELAAAFDRLKPGRRIKTGWRRGYVLHASAVSLLNGLAQRGLLRPARGGYDGWFDIVEGHSDARPR